MDFKKNIGKRRFTIRIQKSTEGGYIGQCLGLPGAISEAETLKEFKSSMTEAIQLILEAFEESKERQEDGN